jgi:methionine-rich copper-binding protein CopC
MRHILIAALLCFMGITTQADAHAFLVKSSPSVGAAVKPGFSELRLEFSEPVELAFSGVELAKASGVPVPLASFGFGDSTHKMLAAKVSMLMPGSYVVKWHVVSVDTHRTEGSFTFRVMS